MKMKNFKITSTLLLALLLSANFLTAQSWLKTGNPGVLATDYLGPQNNVPLRFKVNGQNAGTIASTGMTAYGYQAGGNGTSTSLGFQALMVGGGDNTAVGYQALKSNPNSAGGSTAVGHKALTSNVNGWYLTAVGWEALKSNIDGELNTAVGSQALTLNTSGSYNCATGASALSSLGTGDLNTGLGYAAYYSGNGNENTAIGGLSLLSLTTGSSNTALGVLADVGSNNLNGTVAIGHSAIVNASDKIRLGNTIISVIEGQVAYSYPSDGRFKTNVTNDVKGLDFITRLRPVVYNFDTRKFDEFLCKNMSDSLRNARMEGVDYGPSTAVRQSGFIAQEVETVAKEIGYDFNGIHAPVNENDNYSIAYSQFVMPLVKAVQELNASNIALQERFDAREELIQKLLSEKRADDAGIQSPSGR